MSQLEAESRRESGEAGWSYGAAGSDRASDMLVVIGRGTKLLYPETLFE